MKNKIILGHLLAFFTIVIWGTTFIASKILLEDLNPFSILFYRFLLGYVTLLIIHPKFHKVKNIKEEFLFLGAGISGVTLYMLAENMALTYSKASNVGLIVSSAPLFIALLLYIFFKEKISKNFILGFIIAFTGIFLVMFNGSMLKLNPTGDFLALLAAILWGFYNLFYKKLSLRNYNILYLVRKMFFYAILSMVPLFLFFDFNMNFNVLIKPKVFLNLLFLGIIASSMCYVTWSKACDYLGNIKTSAYIYLIPFITIITSYFVLNENMSIISFIGCLLILLGLYISDRKKEL